MKIAIIGTGYVGLVSGACLADMGHGVTCIDINHYKIEGLKKGIIPIYEPGLEELVTKNTEAGRLHFSTDMARDIDSFDAVFCAVGTPQDEDGSADLSHVLEVARMVGRHITGHTVFVTKSTVPVGTGSLIRTTIQQELDRRGANVKFDVASNPEFLKEGAAIADFMHPDRIVVGLEDERAHEVMEAIYKPLTDNGYPVIYTDILSAEMIKYASNAMLATRISFMNDIANLCELLGANVDVVKRGIGADSRIGDKFLNPGIGYGGSCFPKDVRALIRMAETRGYDMQVLHAAENVNQAQKSILFRKLALHFGGELSGRKIALWGLSFKPGTDDMREAPSLVIIHHLLEAGCEVRACDPTAMNEARRILGDTITYVPDMYEAAEGAEAVMLLTEWDEFRKPDWERLRSVMREPVVLDGRNIYDRKELSSRGFTYYGIGC